MARIGSTMAAGLLLALAAPIYLAAIDRAAAAPSHPAAVISAGDGWVREAGAKGDWRPTLAGTAFQSFDVFRRSDAEVASLVGLYPLPARGSLFTKAVSELADPKTWRIVQTGRKTLTASGRPLTVDTAVLERPGRYRLVWWYYAVDGYPTASKLEAKLLQARTAFSAGTHTGLFRVITTQADELTAAEAALTSFLGATADYLRSAY